jgi:LacI family transcriptional regulator
MPRLPTLQTVAAAAGVSRMTVSLALRNHPSLPRTTRERLQAIARQLGYRPNPLISALMRQVRGRHPVSYTTTLAYLTTFATRDGWRRRPLQQRFLLGVTRRAEQLGYRVEQFWLREPGMTARRMNRILEARGIHGIIVAPLPRSRGHLSLDWARFAAATIGYSLWRPSLHRAVNHQTHSIALAVRQLRRRGYRRLALALSAEVDARADHHWVAGFLAQRQHYGADRAWPLLVAREWTERQFARWFRAQQPDVVLSTDLHVLHWLQRLGQNISAETGFAYLEWTDEARGCAGIRQHAQRVGAAAVDLVVEQLEHNERGVPPHPKVVLIEGEWIDGPTVSNKRRAR